MSRVTIITKLRFLAGITPLMLLLVSPILALALSAFGNVPNMMRDNEFAAIRYAQALDVALYKMEWGRTQPDGSQIVFDQERRFADQIDSAVHHAYTREQRERVQALAQAAKPTLDEFRHADPRDQAVNAKMRALHALVTDLQNADDTALARFSENARDEARQFIVLVLIAGVLLPIVCFAVIWRMTETVRIDLRTIRNHLDRLSEHAAANDASLAPDLRAIDEAATRLGFPKPNPMLAEQ